MATPSLGPTDILRALITAAGGTLPSGGSAGPGELWKALYAAGTPVTNPSFGLTDSYRNVITANGGTPGSSCGEGEMFSVLATTLASAGVSQGDGIPVPGQCSR